MPAQAMTAKTRSPMSYGVILLPPRLSAHSVTELARGFPHLIRQHANESRVIVHRTGAD